MNAFYSRLLRTPLHPPLFTFICDAAHCFLPHPLSPSYFSLRSNSTEALDILTLDQVTFFFTIYYLQFSLYRTPQSSIFTTPFSTHRPPFPLYLNSVLNFFFSYKHYQTYKSTIQFYTHSFDIYPFHLPPPSASNPARSFIDYPLYMSDVCADAFEPKSCILFC